MRALGDTPLERIRAHLVGMKMCQALEVLDDCVRRVEDGQLSALELLEELLGEEWATRETRRIKSCLMTARLTRIKTLEGFDFGFQPPSTYYERKAKEADRSPWPARIGRDARLREYIRRVWEQNFWVYGVHTVWRRLRLEGVVVARCTVARLMRELGLRGVVRGRRVRPKTAVATLSSPPDWFNRVFRATGPNAR